MPVKAKPASTHRETSATQTIAWQGITVLVPQAWSLVAASGDESAGSVRVDLTGVSDIGDAYGIEVRWSKIKQTQTSEMLDKRIKPLLDNARKSARKLQMEPEINLRGYDDKRHPERDIVREFSWSAEGSGFGRIWRCSQCGRLMIAQVYGREGSRYLNQAREILATLECHGSEEGWVRWALYGLDVQVPADFLLSSQQLMNIYLELKFTRGSAKSKFGDILTVEQWSAANVQLKGAYLDEWIEAKGASMQRTLKIDKAEAAVHGHPALGMSGNRTGLGYWLNDGVRQLTSLHRPALRYASVAWECPVSNRVFQIQSMTARREDEMVAEMAQRTLCHDGTC